MNNVGCLTFFLSKFCIVYGFISQGSLMAALPTLQKEGFHISVYLLKFLMIIELKTKKAFRMGSAGNCGDNVSTRFSLYDYSCSDRENYSANG